MSGCELDIRSCGSVAATNTQATGKGTQQSWLSLIVRRFQMVSTYFLNVFSLKKSVYLQFCFIVAYVNEKYRRKFCKNFRCKQCRLEVQHAKWWKYVELMLSADHWNVRKRESFFWKEASFKLSRRIYVQHKGYGQYEISHAVHETLFRGTKVRVQSASKSQAPCSYQRHNSTAAFI